MGDRWVEKDLSRSTYVWLPLRVAGDQVVMEYREYWDSPLGQSSASRGQPDLTYSVKDGKLSGGAKMLAKDVAGYIGGTASGGVTFPGIQSQSHQRKTLKINYSNGDRATRYASILVNGGKQQKVAFLSTEGGKGISVVPVELKAGRNDVEITGINGGWGPDIISVEVPAG